MIDIGANLTNRAFDDDRAAVLRRAADAGVAALIVTGTSIATSRSAIDLAATEPTLFATAGVHPHNAGHIAAGWDGQIAELAASPRVVAIGETGLDYFRDYSPREHQRRAFRRQIELAVEARMPLFVHDRESGGDTRAILGDYRQERQEVRCVIHCFTGSAAELDGYLEDGFHIGVTGWICDERRGGELAELVRRIPADKLMIETDAPYLLPRTMSPRPRSRRNEPGFLPWVARRVAECRCEDPAVVDRRTHANAVRFFGLPDAFLPNTT